MPDEIDVRKELDEARLRAFHWGLVVLVFAAILFDGYDIVAPSYVIQFVAKPWHLSASESGFLVSIGLIGVMLGSLSHGIAADRIGRRPTMIAGLLLSGTFSLLTALFANSYGSFVVLRLLTGLGLGVVMPLGTAYINEYLPERHRFRLASLAAAGFSLGAVVASIVGIVFTSRWQALFYVGSGAAVVGLLFLAVFPESTEFLVAKRRTAEAARILARLRPERATVYSGTSFAEAAPRARRDWLLPLRRPYRVATMALWLSSLFLLFDNYGLTAWTPTLMVDRGAGFALGFSFGAVLHSIPFVGGILCGYVADRWLGRRVSLVLWCGLGAAATLSVVFTRDPVANVVAIAAAGFFLIGGQFMLNNVCAMTYPVEARGTGIGYMLGVGRIGGILGPYLGGVTLGAVGGTDALFVLAAITGALVMVTGAFIGSTAPRAATARAAQQVS